MRISDWSSDVCSSDLVAHQPRVIFLRNAVDARRTASLDLIEQARPRAVREEAVGAAAQEEGLLQRVERLVDRPRARERAVISPLGASRAALLLHERKSMVGAQQDEGKAFVVAPKQSNRRAVTIDRLGLGQQSTGTANRRAHHHTTLRGP